MSNSYFKIVDPSDGVNFSFSNGGWSTLALPGSATSEKLGVAPNFGGVSPHSYTGEPQASWNFTSVPAGTYDIMATWYIPLPTSTNGFVTYNQQYAGTGTYSITDNVNSANSIAAYDVDQGNIFFTLPSTTPVPMPTFFDLYMGGFYWVKIGTVTSTGSGSFTVNLIDHGDSTFNNSYIKAHAVRLMRKVGSNVAPDFTDAFSGGSLDQAWQVAGRGAWSLNSGYVSQTSSTTGPTRLLLANEMYHLRCQIQSQVRVDAWTGSDARCGVSLFAAGYPGLDHLDAYNNTNFYQSLATTYGGAGFNLFFWRNSSGISVALSSDVFSTGLLASVPFTVDVGTWYNFLLYTYVNPSTGKDAVAGYVWKVGDSQPGTPTITWDYTGSVPFSSIFAPSLGAASAGGRTFSRNMGISPALYGGAGDVLSSFANVSVSTPNVFFGNSSLTPSHPTLSVTDSVSGHSVGLSTLSKSATFRGAGLRQAPVYTANASVTPSHATIASDGEINHVHGTMSGSSHPTIASAGVNNVPTFTGTAVITKSLNPTISALDNSFSYAAADKYAPFFARGHDAIDDGPTLFIDGIAPANTSNVPLFIKSWNSINNGDFHLFLKGFTPTIISMNKSGSLYIGGLDGNGSEMGLPLYTDGFVQSSSEGMNLFIANNRLAPSVPLVIKGALQATSFKDASTTLFIKGLTTYNGGVPLYINPQGTIDGNVPLFMSSPTPINSQKTLFISGIDWTGMNANTPLFLKVADPVNEGMNLFLKTLVRPTLNTSTNLSVRGVTSGINEQAFGAPLTIIGESLHESMNMFVRGVVSGATSEMMNMFVRGTNDSRQGNCTLFIGNSYAGSSKTTKLFIEGDGLNWGYFPFSDKLNMFVQRGPNAGMTLFIANYTTPGSADLFVHGNVPFDSNATLFVNGFGEDLSQVAPLFVHGATFTEIDNNVQLSIPQVVGVVTMSAGLYVNGFNY